MQRAEFLPSEGLEVSGGSGKPRYVLVAHVCKAVHQVGEWEESTEAKHLRRWQSLSSPYSPIYSSSLCPGRLLCATATYFLMFGLFIVWEKHGSCRELLVFVPSLYSSAVCSSFDTLRVCLPCGAFTILNS